MQDKTRSAAEGQQIAAMVVRTLLTLRSDNSFDLFWLKVMKQAELLELEPHLPRRRKAPRRYEDGLAESEFHDDTKAYFRQLYFEAVDLAVNCIQDRFQQPGYKVYSNLEQLILKAAEGEDITAELDFVCDFYKTDLDKNSLRAQLLTFGVEFKQSTYGSSTKSDICDVKKYFQSITGAQRSLLAQVCTVLQLILVMPATNATSERSFSALRRVKTFLRNTMSQQRMNNLMLLHIHKYITDSLDLKAVANEFVADSDHRLKVFGTFK